MRTRIEIDTKTFVRFWLVILGFIVVAFAFYSARNALIIVGAAAFLALALNKPVTRLADALPGNSRVGGTAIAYVIIVALIGGFLFLVVPPIVEQTAKVVQSIPSLVDGAQTQWKGIDTLINHYGLQSQVDNAVNSAKANATSWAASIGSNIVSSLGSLIGLLASIFLVLVLSFLMLIEGPHWLSRVWALYNDEDRMLHHEAVAKKMYNVFTGYVTGQLTVSSIGAFFAGLTVFILSFIFNVPHNLALPSAAIAFVLSLIPMFGSTIAGILISLLLLFNDITAGIVFAVYFVIYQQIENNFVSPTIQSKTVELSALAVLASVTIGLYVFGLAGGIISIPLAGCAKVLLEDYLERAHRNRKKSEKPLHRLARKIEGDA